MVKRKRKLTPAEKAAKKRRRKEYMTIFVNGKQKRVRRPSTIDGMDVDEFIRNNADPIWLHQNGMWEYMYVHEENNADEDALDDALLEPDTPRNIDANKRLHEDAARKDKRTERAE